MLLRIGAQRRIDRLEERIGYKLFLRDQSGLTASEEGFARIADVTEMERTRR
jgi:DNA-binding transcriptional LysR family regulator